MSQFQRYAFHLFFVLAAVAPLLQGTALATNGTWTATTGTELWSNTTNWSGSIVANGTDGIADFSTLNITADNTVHLDSVRTIGNLLFGDTTPSNNWTLDSNGNAANVLTLAVSSGAPTITVNNQTAKIGLLLSGSQGLTKAGTGQLTLAGANTYTGATKMNVGTVLAALTNAIPSTSAVSVDGTFNMGGFAQSIGSLTGTGSVTTTGTTFSDTLIVGNDNTSPAAFTGSITNASGGRLVSLVKVGTGTLTLGGSSPFSGGLQINGGTVELNSSGILSAVGGVTVGAGAPSTSGILTLDGGSSSIIESGSNNLVVGTGGATGTVNIGTTTNGATFTTGTGPNSIFSGSTINIGSGAIAGTFNANGNLTITAGVLARNAGTFTLASSKIMTIQNAGRASFTGNYDTANAIYNITDSGSKLETLAGGFLRILNGGQVNVSAGGLLSSANILDVASTAGTGTLSAVGNGTSVTAVSSGSSWGNNGGTANVTFSDGATGSFGATSLALGSMANTAGTLNVQSGASVSFGNLLIADTGGTGVAGTININGPGSLLSQTGATLVTVGSNSTGTANINIGTTNTGGTLTTGTGGSLTINKTGTIAIGSGANTGVLNANGNVTIDGGALALASGSTFALAAARTMTIQNVGSATFSVNNYIPPNNAIYNVTGAGSTWQFTGTNSFPIVNAAQVTISAGGALSTGGAINVASNGTAGTLTVDGSGSSAIASGSNCIWGQNGNAANVTFSHSANGQFNNGVTLANGSTPGSTANVSVESGATWTSTGNIQIGNSAGTGSSATLTVTGVGSSVTQNASAPLTVGTGGSGAVNGTLILTNGGTWTSNGSTTIQARGLVDIQTPSSSLNANGNVVIDGGVLQVANGLSFNLFAGKTMTVQNGGRASITGGYSTATNAVYNVTGAGSKMENLVANNINIAAGAQVNVSSGGLLTSIRNIDLANGGNGTLTVDAASFSAGLTSNWGFNGATATATFSNNAVANFMVLNLVAASASGTTANVTFQTGADLSASVVNLDSQGGSTSGTLTITDTGSSVALNNGSSAALNIGSSSGTATLNVNNNATFAVLGNSSTTMNSTAVININGGSVALNTLTYNGGTVNLNSGSLSYAGNLTVGLGGMLGQNLTLDSTKSLTLSGTTTIDAFHTLTVSGGTFNTGTLVANGTLNFTSGTVGITGAGGLTVGSGGALGSSLTLNSGTTLNVTSGATTVNSGSSLTISGGTFLAGFGLTNFGNVVLNSGNLTINGGLGNGASGLLVIGQNATAAANAASTNFGELQLGGAAATLAGTGTLTNNGLIRGDGVLSKPVTNAAGAEIRAESGKRIKLTGSNGANNGKINLQGGTVEFTQALTNGSAQPGEIIGRGTLIVGATGLTNNGNIALSGGISDVFGDLNNSTGLANVGVSISGAANVTFWDDVTNGAGSLFKVSTGSTATFFGTYAGAGVSGSGQVNFESDVTPGFSPASISFGGNVALSTTAKLKIELGGTTAGTQFDRVQVANQLSLDGTLNVSLINGFTPAPGNSFDILDWVTLTGTFGTLQLPALAGGLAWNTSQLYTTGTLSVGGILGDYNHNGVVDAADYVVWRKTLGQTGTTLAADGNANNQIDNGDYDVWRAHFGQTAGSGSGAGVSANAAVPEPATFVMLMFAASGWCFLRGQAQRKYRELISAQHFS